MLIEPLGLAALAAGADGIMIEVHPQPQSALCDGNQSLKPERFKALVAKIKALLPVVQRSI